MLLLHPKFKRKDKNTEAILRKIEEDWKDYKE